MAVAHFPLVSRSRRRLGVVGDLEIDASTSDLAPLQAQAQTAVVGAVQDGLAQGFEVIGKIAAGIAGGAAAGLVAVTGATSASVASALGLTASTAALLPGIGIAAGAVIGAIAVIASIGVIPGNPPPPNLDDAGWDTLGGAGIVGKLLARPESDFYFVTSTSTPISPFQVVPVLTAASTIGAWCLQHVVDIDLADVSAQQQQAAIFLWQSNWPAIWSALVNKENPVVPGGLYDAILQTTGFQTINSRLFANALARCLGAPENGQPFPAPAPSTSLLSNVVAPPAPIPINPATGLPYPNGYSPSNPPPANGGIFAGGWQPISLVGLSSSSTYAPKVATPAAAPAAGLSTGAKVAIGGAAAAAAGVGVAQALGVNVLGWLANALSIKDLVGRLRK